MNYIFTYLLTYLLKLRYGDSADNTVEENSSIVHNPNALVTVSKGMWAAKLCTNKIEENSSIVRNPNALVTVSKGMWAAKLCTNKIFNWRCQLMQADLYNDLRGWL